MKPVHAHRRPARAGIALCWSFALVPATLAIAGPYAYVPVASSYTVSVIDTATNAVIDGIPAGEGPIGVAVSPDGLLIYVASQNAHSMIAIDALTDTVIGTLALASDPFGLAVTPDGSQIYVALSGIDAIAVVDAQSLTVLDTIEVGMTPRAVAFTPDGGKAYVANQNGASVSVIDTQDDNTVIRHVPAGGFALGAAVNPAGDRAYVATSGAGSGSGLVVIDTATDAIVTTITVGEARGVAVAPDGRVYVSHDDSVSIVDPATNTVATTVPTGQTAYGVSLSRDGARAYVVNTNGASVSVIDTASAAVISTIPLAGGAFSLGNFVGPPIMPHAPVLAASGRQQAIRLTFDAPRDGGSAILDYTATCGTASVTGTASPLTIGGLSNGVTHACSVVARNAIGTGPASNVVQATAGVADAIFIDGFDAP